jgi:hypothetical protein
VVAVGKIGSQIRLVRVEFETAPEPVRTATTLGSVAYWFGTACCRD